MFHEREKEKLALFIQEKCMKLVLIYKHQSFQDIKEAEQMK